MATNVTANDLVEYWESDSVPTLPDYTKLTSQGFATDGNPMTGLVATLPGAAWFNLIAAMRVSVIKASGLTPATTPDPLQFLRALQSLDWMTNGSIRSTMIADKSITTAKLADGAVTGTQLASDSVTQSKIASSAVGTNEIANGAVTAGKLGAKAVERGKIADGAVTATQLANDAVTQSKIASKAVGTNEIADGAIGATQLGSNAVTNAKIANSAVTGAKIANSTISTDKLSQRASKQDIQNGTSMRVVCSDVVKQYFDVICPPGMFGFFHATDVPEGWLLCNGATVSRTTYARLFAKIGTKYGSGNGSTTFNLPNLNDRVLQGTTNTGNVGNRLEAALPNITGGSGWSINGRNSYWHVGGGGALFNTGNNVSKPGLSIDGSNIERSDDSSVRIDASRSSSIYKGSSLQPKALYLLPCIRY